MNTILDTDADRKLVKSGSYIYTVSLNTPKIWNQLMLKRIKARIEVKTPCMHANLNLLINGSFHANSTHFETSPSQIFMKVAEDIGSIEKLTHTNFQLSKPNTF